MTKHTLDMRNISTLFNVFVQVRLCELFNNHLRKGDELLVYLSDYNNEKTLCVESESFQLWVAITWTKASIAGLTANPADIEAHLSEMQRLHNLSQIKATVLDHMPDDMVVQITIDTCPF